MASTWWYEQTKLLIALWSDGLDLYSSIIGSYPWFSSRLKHMMVMIIVAATRYGAILSHTARLPCVLYLNFRRCEQNHN